MSTKWTNRMSRFHKITTLLGGGLSLAAAILVRLLTENPRLVLHRLAAGCHLPPLWFLGFVWLAGFCLLGAAMGFLLGNLCCGGSTHREALLWRGSTCLILALVISLVWYVLLFGKFSLFFSWLCLPLAMALALLCALSWWRLSRGASLILGGYALWMLCLFLLQFAVMLHN